MLKIFIGFLPQPPFFKGQGGEEDRGGGGTIADHRLSGGCTAAPPLFGAGGDTLPQDHPCPCFLLRTAYAQGRPRRAFSLGLPPLFLISDLTALLSYFDSLVPAQVAKPSGVGLLLPCISPVCCYSFWGHRNLSRLLQRSDRQWHYLVWCVA